MDADTKQSSSTFPIMRQATFLEAIIRQLPEAILVFDAESRLVYANPKALKMARGTASQLCEKKFYDLFDVSGATGSQLSVDELADYDRHEVPGQMYHCDSCVSDVAMTSSRITDTDGNPYLLCFVKSARSSGVGQHQHTLTKIASELISVTSVADVLEKVTHLVTELTQAEHATIAFIDEDNKNFTVQAEYPLSDRPTVIGAKIPIEGHPTQEELVSQKKPIIAPDAVTHPISLEPGRIADFICEMGIQSTLFLPMVSKGRVIGELGVASIRRPRTFCPNEVDMYRAIADQTAMAIENSRMLENAFRLQKQYSEVYSAASLDNVAVKILADLAQRVAFRKASVQLIINGRRVLLSAHGFDKDKASPRLLGRIEHDPIVKEIIETKQIRIIADTRDEPAWSRQPETSDVNSWIGIPVVWNDESVALITLDHDEYGFYGTIGDAAFNSLLQLATTAALEIHEAYLFDAAQRQLEAFALVNRIAEIATARLEKTELLNCVVHDIAEALHCPQCTLFLAQRDVDALVAQASWVPVAAPADCHVHLHGGATERDSPILHAYRKAEHVVISDFQDPATAERFALGPGIPHDTQSMAAIPIIIADQTIGVLTVSHSKKINAFNESDALLLETVMRYAAIAIERDAGLDVVHRVGHEILRATNLAHVLKEIVTGAIKLTHAATGVIYLVNANEPEIVGEFYPAGTVHPQPRLDKGEGITRTVIETKQMLEIEDITADDRVNPELRGRYRSMVAIPLVLDDEVNGVLYLNGTKERVLTTIEKWFALTLADQAAIAIQRMRLDQQLRDSEAIYHSLVDHIPHFVFRKDEASRFTSANAQFCRSIGRTIQDTLGKTDHDFYPPADAEAYINDDRHVMRTGQPLEKVERHQSSVMEKPLFVKVVKTPVKDSEGRITGVQAIFWDVTLERQLQERYRSLVDQSPDSIIVHEAGIIKLANPAALRLFGVSTVAEIENRSIIDFIDSDHVELAQERLRSLARNEAVDEMVEMRIMRRGKKVDVAVYARPLQDNGGSQIVFHDLTQHNALLEEMHHRVGKALNEVSQYLAQQRMHTPHPDVVRAFRGTEQRILAMAEVHRMIHTQWGKSQVPIEKYLQNLIDAVFMSHGVANGDVTFNVSAAGVALDEDKATACGLIVAELVSNSLMYAFREDTVGRIEVHLSREGGSCRLVVMDTGQGFSSDHKSPGSSMGLTLVRRVVDGRLKGTMEMTTKDGVSATICFPVPPVTAKDP